MRVCAENTKINLADIAVLGSHRNSWELMFGSANFLQLFHLAAQLSRAHTITVTHTDTHTWSIATWPKSAESF